MGKAKPLRRDSAAKVCLITDEQIRLPCLAYRENICRLVARIPPGESLAHKERVSLSGICQSLTALLHRTGFRCAPGIDPGGKDRESRSLDSRNTLRRTGKGDTVACGLGGARNRNKRVEMAAPIRKGKENSQARLSSTIQHLSSLNSEIALHLS